MEKLNQIIKRKHLKVIFYTYSSQQLNIELLQWRS